MRPILNVAPLLLACCSRQTPCKCVWERERERGGQRQRKKRGQRQRKKEGEREIFANYREEEARESVRVRERERKKENTYCLCERERVSSCFFHRVIICVCACACDIVSMEVTEEREREREREERRERERERVCKNARVWLARDKSASLLDCIYDRNFSLIFIQQDQLPLVRLARLAQQFLFLSCRTG